MTRTLIIGLDGATWDEIKPLAIEGGLPTLLKSKEEKKLISQRISKLKKNMRI